jgi:HEPN domain-containing protein
MKIEEHIQFWIESADNDLDTAQKLFEAEKFDWCLFLGHLVLEKALKAHYVQDNENQMPPRIHNLVKLAEKTRIPLSEENRVFFDEVSDFNLQVRYPEYKREFQKKCTSEFCDEKFTKIKEHYKWLKSQLKSGKS